MPGLPGKLPLGFWDPSRLNERSESTEARRLDGGMAVVFARRVGDAVSSSCNHQGVSEFRRDEVMEAGNANLWATNVQGCAGLKPTWTGLGCRS